MNRFKQAAKVNAILDNAVRALALQESLLLACARAIGDRKKIREIFSATFEPAVEADWAAFHAEFLGGDD